MPVHVEKRGKKYVIVETATGKIKGHSDNRKNAEISAWKRNQAYMVKRRGGI